MIAAAIRTAGAVCGAVLALVFQPPVDMKELRRRSFFSTGSGFLFGDLIRTEYLHWPGTWEMWLAASAITAMASWWVFGTILKVISAWKPK